MRLGWVEYAIMAAIAGATSLYVILFHFPAPYFDHWDIAPLLEAADSNALNPADLFAIHGGHWHASAYALFIPLARLTHWSPLAEALASLVFLFATCLVLLHLARNFAAEACGDAALAPFATATVFLCFALDQSSNLLWSFQLSVFVSLFGSALCIAALTQARFTLLHFAMAQLGLALAVTSYATGFALVPVGLALIAIRAEASIMRRLIYAGAWLAVSGLWLASFLVAQSHTPYGRGFNPSDVPLNEMLPYLLDFELNYLGAAIARLATSLIIPMAIVGPILVTASTLFLTRRGVSLRTLAIPLALCAFAFGAGLLCGIGRFEFGAGQGSNGRYFSFSAWFWLGAAWLILAALARLEAKAWRRGAIAFLALCALLKLASGIQAAQKNVRVTAEVAAIVEAMRADPANAAETAQAIAWERQDIARHVAFIQEKRWSVFRGAQGAENP